MKNETKKTNRAIQYLHQGLHSKEELELYLKLTKIESPVKRKALHEFLIEGTNLNIVLGRNKLDSKDFRVIRNKLNEVAGVLESLIELRLERGQLKHSVLPSSKEGS